MTTLSGELRVLADIPLDVDPDEILRFQGYKKGIDIPGPDVLALFDDALAIGRTLLVPRAVVRWLPVLRQTADSIELAEARLDVPDVTGLWDTVEHVGVAVCTVGEQLERRVAELWETRELPLSIMLDSVGSGAVESLAEYVNDLLCHEGVAACVKVTNRISPGYGRWDVRDQRMVFRLCPAESIAVTLSEACFMTPVKSISLVVGAGPAARVDHYFSQCRRCWMRDCAYRRVPAARTVRRSTS